MDSNDEKQDSIQPSATRGRVLTRFQTQFSICIVMHYNITVVTGTDTVRRGNICVEPGRPGTPICDISGSYSYFYSSSPSSSFSSLSSSSSSTRSRPPRPRPRPHPCTPLHHPRPSTPPRPPLRARPPTLTTPSSNSYYTSLLLLLLLVLLLLPLLKKINIQSKLR